jgi:hypothetical protein
MEKFMDNKIQVKFKDKINKLIKYYTCIYVSKTIYQVLFNSLLKSYASEDHVKDVHYANVCK